MAEINSRVRMLEDFREGMRADINAILQQVIEEAYQKLSSRLLAYCTQAGLEQSEMVNITKQATEIMIKYNIPDWKIMKRASGG